MFVEIIYRIKWREYRKRMDIEEVEAFLNTHPDASLLYIIVLYS